MRFGRLFLLSRGRLGGHGGGHKDVRKVVGNVVGTRPDFMSGRACPEDDGTKEGGRSRVLATFGLWMTVSPLQPICVMCHQ